MANYKWSYSSANTFEKCPKQYFHLYVAKDVKSDNNSPHLVYGNEVHKACELYVRNGDPLPEQFQVFQPTLDKLMQISGTKYCEYKLGLTRELEPCGFFDNNVWWRGVVDLLIIDEEKGLATLVDYKTGKSSEYADTKQLSLLSVAIFKHFPQIERIKAGLVFLVAKDLVRAEYEVDKVDALYGEWSSIIRRMDIAHDTNVFNPSPNFSCRKHCPVSKCPHWGK